MHIYQHNQTNLEFLHQRATRVGYSMRHHLIKFLIANGVEGDTARKVAFKIQQKVRRNALLATEEKAIVDEYMTRTVDNTSKVNQTMPSSGDRRNKLSDNNIPVPAKNMEYKEGGFNNYVHRQPTRRKVPALKMDVVTKKSKRPPAMIRQLAYRIASS